MGIAKAAAGLRATFLDSRTGYESPGHRSDQGYKSFKSGSGFSPDVSMASNTWVDHQLLDPLFPAGSMHARLSACLQRLLHGSRLTCTAS